MSNPRILVPRDVVRAFETIKNCRDGGRVYTSDPQHLALLECVEALQKAVDALLGRIVALERAAAEAQERAAAKEAEDVPAFLRHRLNGRHA